MDRGGFAAQASAGQSEYGGNIDGLEFFVFNQNNSGFRNKMKTLFANKVLGS